MYIYIYIYIHSISISINISISIITGEKTYPTPTLPSKIAYLELCSIIKSRIGQTTISVSVSVSI